LTTFVRCSVTLILVNISMNDGYMYAFCQ